MGRSHDRQRAILMTASGQLHGRHWAVFRGRRQVLREPTVGADGNYHSKVRAASRRLTGGRALKARRCILMLDLIELCSPTGRWAAPNSSCRSD